jgi:hypothetical protein
MNHPVLRRFLLVAASLAIITTAGCSTLRPLSSKPPVPRIVLSSPFTYSEWHGVLPPTKFSVILPAGEYRPLYEDDQFYYYQAPSKVVVNDLSSSLLDGGMYVPRGATAPRGWYFVMVDGSQQLGEFKTPPPVK